MRTTINFTALFLTLVLIFCSSGCGVHGMLQGYRYVTTKDKLVKAINAVTTNNPIVYQDTGYDIKNYDKIDTRFNISSEDVDMSMNYSEGTYGTVTIKRGQVKNKYIFRYYGDTDYWKNSHSSEIFIIYAMDKSGHGGFVTTNEFDSDHLFTRKMIKDFTDVFEKEFISRLDKELNLDHYETK